MTALTQWAALVPTRSAKGDFWTGFWSGMTETGWAAVRIAAIIVGAFILAWILRLIIRRIVKQIVSGVKKNQRVAETQALSASPLAAVRLVQRTRTLGTVLSNIVNVVIGIIALVTIVEKLSPGVIGSLALLTAAIGAGLGFGAQNIVKDVFNGLFMVMEDQLGVGDVVDVQLATGVVEAVGIRVTQVRDVNGVLWFVRNGEILRVGNLSQGWSRVIIDLAVPYETDVEEVQHRMLETANALASDPKWRARIVEKPEIWGLQSVSDDALVIRIVIKSRSVYRDDVARELRLRLKKTTDEMGIVLPSLTSVILSGFDDIASIGGAHAPRTNPIPIERPEKARRGRKRVAAVSEAPAGTPRGQRDQAAPASAQSSPTRRTSDPRAIPIVNQRRPADGAPAKPTAVKPAAEPTTEPAADSADESDKKS